MCPGFVSVLVTNFWFVQQADDNPEGSEVSTHILRFVIHILLFEDVNQSLRSLTRGNLKKKHVT